MASEWNRLLDRLLEQPLTANEYRLALAIARSTLGYRRRSEQLGRRLLQERAHITDTRGFERARDGLVDAGLLDYTPGRPGRGGRSTYALILDAEKAALTRPKPEQEKRPLSDAKKAAPARPRIGTRRERTPAAPATASVLVATLVETYQSAGGSLELADWRGALAQQGARLAKNGIDETLIVAAARELGRRREFPGYLRQRVDELAAAGGVCTWEGLDASRLTVEQLGECGCNRCAAWLEHRSAVRT